MLGIRKYLCCCIPFAPVTNQGHVVLNDDDDLESCKTLSTYSTDPLDVADMVKPVALYIEEEYVDIRANDDPDNGPFEESDPNTTVEQDTDTDTATETETTSTTSTTTTTTTTTTTDDEADVMVDSDMTEKFDYCDEDIIVVDSKLMSARSSNGEEVKIVENFIR